MIHTPLPVTTLRIPNPFLEGRNRVYVIHSDPITVIDTGVATEKARRVLQEQLQEHQIPVESIGRIILTHKHIDHVGNAWWMQRDSGAEILIHELETHAVTDVDPAGERWRGMLKDRLLEWGVPEEQTRQADSAGGVRWEIESATARAFADQQTIELGSGAELEVIHTPGHTQGSVCLKFGRTLFSGDHVLPDVSPNIGGGDLRHRRLLKGFLTSLQRCQELAPEIDCVLPGHGNEFEDLAGRSQKLMEHHHKRLDQVMWILKEDGPQTAHQLAMIMFGSLRGMHTVLGCAEAYSHLEYLQDEQRVRCDDGVWSIC